MFSRTHYNWLVWYHWDILDLSVRQTLTCACDPKKNPMFVSEKVVCFCCSVQGTRKTRLDFFFFCSVSFVYHRHFSSYLEMGPFSKDAHTHTHPHSPTQTHTNPRLHCMCQPAVPSIWKICIFYGQGEGGRGG